MFDFIKPNSILAWITYFAFLLFFWFGIALIVFLSLDGVIGFESRLFLGVLCFTITSMISLIRPNEGGLRRVPLGHQGVLMIGDKILLIIKAGPVAIFPGVIELQIDSMRIRKGKFILDKIETGDPKIVDYTNLKVVKNQFSDTDLDRQIALRPEFEIFYYIEGKGYEEYKKNVGDNDQFLEIIPDMAAGIASEQFSLRTPAIINAQKKEISEIIQSELQREIDFKENPERSWRIKIQKIQMGKIGLPESIVLMMEEKVLAEMRKYVTIINAQATGEAIHITEVFKFKAQEVGTRLIEAARGIGKAEGYDALAKALKMEKPEMLAQLDTIENTFKNTEKLMFAGSPEMNGILSFLPALGEVLKGSGLTKK